MRSSSTTFSDTDNPETRKSADRCQARFMVVAVLLLAVFLLINWVPVEATEESGSLSMVLVLLWVLGGLGTIGYMMLAGRKPG
ncbi:MAG: hypothetical protein ACK5HY_12080 [Parahaliea sp.]